MNENEYILNLKKQSNIGHRKYIKEILSRCPGSPKPDLEKEWKTRHFPFPGVYAVYHGFAYLPTKCPICKKIWNKCTCPPRQRPGYFKVEIKDKGMKRQPEVDLRLIYDE